jgi:hypothetical protein
MAAIRRQIAHLRLQLFPQTDNQQRAMARFEADIERVWESNTHLAEGGAQTAIADALVAADVPALHSSLRATQNRLSLAV